MNSESLRLDICSSSPLHYLEIGCQVYEAPIKLHLGPTSLEGQKYLYCQ